MPSKARIRAAIVALAVPAVVFAGTPASAGEDAEMAIKRCWLEHSDGSTYLYASLTVQNKDPNNKHSYKVNITFNKDNTRLGRGTTSVYNVAALESGKNDASTPVVSNPSESASDVQAGDVECDAEAKDDEGLMVDRKHWPPPPPPKEKDEVVPDQTVHTVVRGDTLSDIADHYYGDASKWKVIYNANRDTIESAAREHGRASSDHGHWIYPGTELVIPKQ